MNKYLISILFLASLTAHAKYSFMYDANDFDKILDLSLKNFIQSGLNEGDQNIQTKYISSKGTSAYITYKVSSGQINSIGAILAKAESTNVLGEIVSYKLARILNIEEIYSAKTLVKVEGLGLETYKEEMLKLEHTLLDPANAKMPGLATKKANLKNVLSFIQNDKVLWCALAPWGHRPFDWDSLTEEEHPLRQSITANGVQPSALTIEDIKNYVGVHETILEAGAIQPRELAIELSNHMIIDILTGQYDRFSGGNLQYFIDDAGKIHIGAFDNGGTFDWSDNRAAQYFKIVSRFDKNLIFKLKQLQKFLNREADSYQNISSESELLNILELSKDVPQETQQLSSTKNIYSSFRIALKKLIQHIDKTCENNGEANCYFN